MASHLFLHRKLRYKKPNLIVFLVGVVSAGVLLFGLLLVPVIVNAAGGGAAGGGGGAGCTSNCNGGGSGYTYYTDNGWGWAEYPVDSSGPTAGFRDKTAWSYVQDTCRGLTVPADKVIGFVVLSGKTDTGLNPDSKRAMIYHYMSVSSGQLPIGYQLTNNDGTKATIIDDATAQSYFNLLTPAERNGLIWHNTTDKNGVAWFCYNSHPENWTINGQSYIKLNGGGRVQGEDAVTAKPGDTLYWDHDLRNNGPTAMNNNVTINIDRQDRLLTSGAQLSFGSNPAGMQRKGAAGALFYTNYGISRTVGDSDVGNKLCQRIAWSPNSSSDSSWGHSGYACANVPYNYNLNPSVNISKTTASVGDTVYVSPIVTNNGATKSNQTTWSLVTFTVNPGVAVPAGGTGNQPPTVKYGGSSVVASGTNAVFPTGITSVAAGNQTVPDKAVGSHVCWLLAVQPYSQSTTDWRYSTPSCLVVSKSPRVQIWGSDLWVGVGGLTSNVVTSLTGRGSDNMTYGSWSEYAIVASGTSKTMASGSALNNGVGGTPWSGTNCNVVKETFTNAGSSGCSGTSPIGSYNTLSSLPDVSAAFKSTASLPASSAANPLDVNSLATGVYSGSGAIYLKPTTISGRWVVINAPSATVYIVGSGQLQYTTGTINSVNDLPQLVIIANTINIAGGVTQVDAWLIARPATANVSAPNGSIYTCSDVANTGGLNSNTCNKALVVNGPVSAQHLFLYRTAGAGTGSAIGDPAEIFNLRPDAYMWAYERASSSNQVSTMQTKELPPRF